MNVFTTYSHQLKHATKDRRGGRLKGRRPQVMVYSPLSGSPVPRQRKGNGPAGERDHVARSRIALQKAFRVPAPPRRIKLEVPPVVSQKDVTRLLQAAVKRFRMTTKGRGPR